uniref:Putative ovule protein n=1 Tax=Solanum chacoense TaxID=4108 RepID=A0A0V0GWD7_SOLCH
MPHVNESLVVFFLLKIHHLIIFLYIYVTCLYLIRHFDTSSASVLHTPYKFGRLSKKCQIDTVGRDIRCLK